jgi:hypothetical protein
MDGVLFDMTPDHTGSADLGEVFQVEVTVDLPHVETATNITMEIFAIDPTLGLGGFTLCNFQEVSPKGANVEDVTATVTSERKEGFPSVVRLYKYPL